MKMFFNKITSINVIIGLSVPLVLSLVLCAGWLGLSLISVADMQVFQVFFMFLFIILIVRTVTSVFKGLFGEAALLVGFVFMFLQGMYSYGSRFDAKTSINLEDIPRNYYSVNAGFLAKTPVLPLLLKDASTGKGDECLVIQEGKALPLRIGQTTRWQNFRITLDSISEAPLFILSDNRGEEKEAGYIKLHFEGPDADFFQFTAIPHRFYVSKPGREYAQWKYEEKKWVKTLVPAEKDKLSASGQMYHLSIVRGKLTLYDADIKRGEQVPFEHRNVRFEQGVPYIKISVVKIQSLYLLYAGILFCTIGSIILLSRRKKS